MIEFRYDTQLLIEGSKLDEDQLHDAILSKFEGDSLVLVGDAELMKVHFHTNYPWQILEYCATLGEIFDIVVEDMVRQSKGLKG
ncbi:kinase to dihydroxyacetone kinase [Paucilactobacillus nenjiangensis]|jgi:dihydroxyacetone kinase-like predicted kinase|uniref:Kinase to dihydroxyacetone kinase n=1 Tax=Paucilactobacillus nenjiangensis TaxID=1296540 RepID=A0A5P1WZ91_9LACO|nr:kinase to dihydroxyacetone kinase [Paucilactobacillus nenjiangensis]QER66465.1 kinase to dihydroxyacetone kinase [Paucilactobacillus nenjiangensis]